MISGYKTSNYNSYSSLPGVDENKSPLHEINEQIQKANSFEELKSVFGQRNSFIDDSIGEFSLEVQKELFDGIMWGMNELKINETPSLLIRSAVSKYAIADYNDITKTMRLRKSLTVEQAFPNTVHEMVHHAVNVRKIDCDKIVRGAAKSLGLRINGKVFNFYARAIAGGDLHEFDELVAYSISGCSVGKGNDLAKAIFKIYQEK